MLIALSSLFLSCTKYDEAHFPEAHEPLNCANEFEAMKNFSIALSKAACNHIEVRKLLKSEALKMFDNDYDVLYQNVKDMTLSDLGTFREVLCSYMSSPSVMESIERMVPDLTIYVTDVTWLDPDGFCAESWDTDDNKLAVTYKDAGGLCNRLFSNGFDLGQIESGTIPGGAVLIVKKNERISAQIETKSGNVTYTFVDDVFDGEHKSETKSNRYNGDHSVTWIAGQSPEDNSDIMTAAALDGYNPDIIAAYDMFKDHSYALQNDYIYYGQTTTSATGMLRSDVKSKIVRFKVSPNSFNALFDDPNDTDMKFVDSFETDDNGKGYGAEPSVSTIYSKLWTDGALEIRVRVAALNSDGTTGICQESFYDVKASDLYTIKDNSIQKDQWGTTLFKWYITWKYTIIGRDENTLVEKWYYPSESSYLPTWNLFENSAYSIIVSEEDTGTETTTTASLTTKKATQTTSKISSEISGNVSGSGAGLSAVYKNELGWSNTDEKTNTETISLSWVNGNDPMTTQIISYRDKYINEQVSPTTYSVYSYESSRFTFTILPCRY